MNGPAVNDNGGVALRGLPEPLPPGETLLWQGAPDWRALAWRAFQVRMVALYFGLIMLWRASVMAWHGEPLGTTAMAVLAIVPVAAVAIGALALLAWLNAITTVYTITSRRIVMKYGLAIPLTFNVPFRLVGAAGLRVHADGAGDMPLSLNEKSPMGYIHLWPHARPWRVRSPEPMLRAVPEAKRVADILAGALRQAVAEGAQNDARSVDAATGPEAMAGLRSSAAA